MKQMSSVKKSTLCALCIALCIVLPVAFHALGVGAVFLPMHIPVFLCALILQISAEYGLMKKAVIL